MDQAQITRLYTEVNKLRTQANNLAILLATLVHDKPEAGKKSISDDKMVLPPSMRKK